MRELSLTRLASGQDFDVLILGGGVNGAAVLREMALNGVSALLLDRSDFCKGATSASSRMAHGGLRYLENREFKLVAESARERNLLLKHASHFTAPLETVVPVRHLLRGLGGSIARFAGLETSGARLSLIGLKGALHLYEYLGRVQKVLPSHRTVITRSRFPKLLARANRAVVSYFDARIRNPEALVLEMLEDSLATNDAVACLNHSEWRLESDGRIVVEDRISARRFDVRPRLIVNATGAWVDHANAAMGLATRYIRPVKGAHLLIRNDALFERMAGRAFYFDDGSGRMVISYPLDRTILLGTTELETNDPGDGQVSDAEIDYLLAAISSLFEDIRIDRRDVVAMTTGVRPLQRGDDNQSANRANRDHRIAEDHLDVGQLRVISLVGGKWTTFRSFAEQAADVIFDRLGLRRHADTLERTFPGATGSRTTLLTELCTIAGVTPLRASALVSRYGSIARNVASFCAAEPDTALDSLADYTTREIRWLVENRAAVNLDDLLLRRTQIVLDGRCSADVAKELGLLLAHIRGLSPEWAGAETARCLAMPTIIPFSGRQGAGHG